MLQLSRLFRLHFSRYFETKAMVFACQNESFLKEFKTTVVSCNSAKLGDKDGFEVLEDTILFPEGGGQVLSPVVF